MIAHLHKRNKTLTNEQEQYRVAIRTELTSTDVVSVKDFSKVKLESFCNSKVPELGKLCVPWFMRVLGFL